MMSTQKVVKYLALGFAWFLAFSIIAGIAAAGFGILKAVGLVGRSTPEAVVDCTQYEKCLSLQISYSDLYIKKGGDKISVEHSDDDYEIEHDGEKLIVKDTKRTSWFGSSSRKFVVSIPESMVFDAVGISSSAGKIEVEKINAKELNLSLGAGETTMKDIEASGKVKIDTGAGKFTIESGEIHDANVSLGVGETNIRAAITGDSKIDAGVGAVNLNLLLPASKYTIKVDKGIGEVKFNDSGVSDGMVAQGGENKIEVNGGIGKIEIKTVEEE